MSGYIGSTPVPQATQHRESFTCTEGQTTFNTAGYTAQFVDVYLNGSHLSPADFTATNGSDVVLGVAASADDVCDIISYTPFEVADATFTGTTTLNGAVVINESSADVDFRVESNGNANMLFVDGGNNAVGIGTGSPSRLLELSNTTNPAIRLNNGNSNVDIGVASSAGALLTGVADDNLVIARNGAFGISFGTNGSLGLNIDATGAVTMPLQPAFSVNKNNTTQSDLATGDTAVTVIWAAERFDQNSDFDLTNNRFVAPVTGKYQLQCNIRLHQIDSAAAYNIITIKTSNLEYSFIFDPDFGQDQTYWSVTTSVLADMDADDTASVIFVQNSGAAQTDIEGANGYTYFTGYLVA